MSKKQISSARRVVKSHTKSSLVFKDEDKLLLTYSNIVIRVSRINRYYGLLKDFVKTHCIHGITNGRLLLITEIDSPARYLHHFGKNVLKPLGFNYFEDFVFAEEVFYYEMDNHDSNPVGQEIPACRRASWLGSEVNEEGNWIWHVRSH